MSPQVSRILRRADTLLWRGRPNECLRLLTAHLKKHPRDAKLWICRGIARSNLDQHAEALRDLDRALALAPRSVYVQANRVRFHIRAGRLKLADRLLKALLRRHPGNAYLICQRGDFLEARGQRRRALREFGRAARLDPKCPHAWLGLAEGYERNEDWKRAIAAWRRAVRLEPGYAYAWHGLDLALDHAYRRKRTPAALRERRRAYRRAEELYAAGENPEDALLSLWRLHRLPAARRLGRRAVRRDPGNARLWNLLGLVDWLTPKRSTLHALSQAIRLDPGNAVYYSDRASHFINGVETREAIAKAIPDLEESLRLDPSGVEQTVSDYVESLLKVERFKEAVRFLSGKRRRAGGGRDDELLAAALYQVKWYRLSAAAWRRALATGIRQASACLGLAKCLVLLGRRRDASRYMARAERLEPEALDWLELEKLHRFMGDPESAKRARSRALKLQPGVLRQESRWFNGLPVLPTRTWAQHQAWLEARGLVL